LPRKIVIIGANAAGVEAASSARKIDRSVEITLLTKEKRPAYSRCGLPYVLGRHISNFENLIIFSPSYYHLMKLDLRLECTATNIDKNSKTVDFRDKTGNQEELQFDDLIMATGSRPFVPPIKGLNKAGIHVLRTLDDGQKIDRALEKSKSIIIVGAGLVGLETAVAGIERGVETTVVELLPYILPQTLDRDIAKLVLKKLEEKGLKIMIGSGVDEIYGTTKVRGVSVAGKKIPADTVVFSTGVRPNVELAQKAGILLGETGGIKTNMGMETSVKDIYACGDCAETINLITHKPMLSQLGTTAVNQGRVAGINAAGGYARFLGSLGSSVTKMFDLEIGATGLTASAAEKNGIKTVIGKLTSKTKAEYYPGAKQITIKLIIDRLTRRIIGSQIVGGEEVTQRINALSFAIQKQMSVDELSVAETCYSPPLNETWEPMVLTAEIAIRKLKRQKD
jgi:NADH oxidase (H2O2-forming)